MLIKIFPSGPFETNAYVAACEDTRLAAIIDPAPGSANSITSYLNTNHLSPDKILITHSHWDHIADTALLKNRYHIPVLIHAADSKNLEIPGSDQLPCWIDFEGVKPDQFFKEGDKIAVGNLAFEVLDTPGHTPGGVCFYCKEHAILFSGDTLFKGTIGNLSFPTARPKLMWESLKKLSKLPPQTLVYPGHGPHTMIGNEKWLSDAESQFGN